jgi:hypothetical protein
MLIQFDRKFQEEVGYDHWSDHDSDVDESAQVPEDLRSGPSTTQRKENDVRSCISIPFVPDAQRLLPNRDRMK